MAPLEERDESHKQPLFMGHRATITYHVKHTGFAETKITPSHHATTSLFCVLPKLDVLQNFLRVNDRMVKV